MQDTSLIFSITFEYISKEEGKREGRFFLASSSFSLASSSFSLASSSFSLASSSCFSCFFFFQRAREERRIDEEKLFLGWQTERDGDVRSREEEHFEGGLREPKKKKQNIK